MTPLMKEFREKYPSLGLYLRGNSGFASPELYKACEEHDCKYAIRLRENKKLKEEFFHKSLNVNNGILKIAGKGLHQCHSRLSEMTSQK